MTTSSDSTRGRGLRSRPRVAALGAAGAVAALVVGGALYAGTGTAGDPREGNALVRDWSARSGGQQVLGGVRTPGVPTVQRLRHDDVELTVTIAPARPGPNLVRVDSTPVGTGHEHHHSLPVLVGTSEHDLVRARPRPGTDGLWAVVDLPAGTGTALVTHGPRHRVPFAVETGPPPRTPDPGRGPTGPSAWPPRPAPCWPAAHPPRAARPTRSPPRTRPHCGPSSTRSPRAGWSSWPCSTTGRCAAGRRTTSYAAPPPGPDCGSSNRAPTPGAGAR